MTIAPAELVEIVSSSTRRWRSFMVVATIAVIGCWALADMDAGRSGHYGLISAFPPVVFLCLAALVASFCLTLWRSPERSPLLAAHVVVLILLLYAAGPLSEHHARTSTAWLHSGFIDQIATTGHTLNTDARFSWPGFFSAFASLLGPAGLHDARPLLLWAPVVTSLLYLLPLIAITRVLAPPRVAWLAVWIFFLTDWTGQEYFSPQGVAMFLFLSFLAITIAYSHGRRESPRPGGSRRNLLPARAQSLIHFVDERSIEEVQFAVTPAQRIGMVVVTAVLAVALVPTHQLTPVALLVILAAFAIVGRVVHASAPLFLGVVLFAYISYFAVAFWVGHLDQLVGLHQGGGRAINQGVGARISGDPAHLRVVYLRLALVGALWIAAFFGVARRARRRRIDIIAITALAPLVLPLVQPYGGEGVIRAFLYTLPFAAVLAARAFLPNDKPGTTAMVAIVGCSLVMIPLFLVAKYGNESFERMSSSDVSAVNFVYDHAPQGASVVALVDNLPWKYANYASYDYVVMNPSVSSQDIAATLSKGKGPAAYLVTTGSQDAYAVTTEGQVPGWSRRLATTLVQNDPRAHIVYSNGDAIVVLYDTDGGSRA